jgi:phage-related protein
MKPLWRWLTKRHGLWGNSGQRPLLRATTKKKLAHVPILGQNLNPWEIARVKVVLILDAARRTIRTWPLEVKKELGAVLLRLQHGEAIGMPDVRPMQAVGRGVSEIRIQDSSGAYRTFYVIESRQGIILFHSFKKKTQKTPLKEIATAKARLADFTKQIGDES